MLYFCCGIHRHFLFIRTTRIPAQSLFQLTCFSDLSPEAIKRQELTGENTGEPTLCSRINFGLEMESSSNTVLAAIFKNSIAL